MKTTKSVRMLMGLLACMVLMTSCATNKIKPIEISQTTENVFSTNTINVLVNNEDDAYKALNSVGELYGFNDAKDEFKAERIDSLNTGTHYKFLQIKNGVPVYGKTMIVSADENGNVFNINGNYCNISENINVTPKIDNKKAQKKIEKEIKKELKNGMFVSEPELVIFAGGDAPVLTWKANVIGYTSKEVFEAYEVFADANTGLLLYKDSINVNLSGEFEGQNTPRVINYMAKENGMYYLVDDERNIIIRKANNNIFLKYEDSDTVSWVHGETPPKDAVDAMANLQIIYDFFEIELNHSSTDGKGENLIVVETNIVFDGDGDELLNNASSATYSSGELSGTRIRIGAKYFEKNTKSNMCDVMAHEYAHGVIHSASGIRSNSALNEAYADIFAICVEDNIIDSSTDWCIDNARNISSPDKTKNPKLFSEFSYDTMDEHHNSTIISHAAYLMWEGDENSGAIKDTTKLAKLWYDSLYMLNSESNFSDCRTAVEISAQRLHALGILTDKQVQRVSEAFNQVGIDPKPLYEIVAVNPELHVYASDNSEYYNYHCKIERASLNSLNTVGKAVEFNYETIKEFDVAEETTINLENLVEAPSSKAYTYRITISDLNDEPGTTQIKHVTVSHNSQNTLDFYTDFVDASIKTAYLEVIESAKDAFDKEYALYDIDKNDVPELLIISPGTRWTSLADVYTYKNNRSMKVGTFSISDHASNGALWTMPDENGLLNIYTYSFYVNEYDTYRFNEYVNQVIIKDGIVEEITLSKQEVYGDEQPKWTAANTLVKGAEAVPLYNLENLEGIYTCFKK